MCVCVCVCVCVRACVRVCVCVCVTRSDKMGLKAEKYTCSVYGVNHLIYLSEYCLFYSIP